jgi:hypothetical protein
MAFFRSVDTEIAASPEQVFALVAGIRRHPSWAYDNLAVKHVAGPTVGRGAEYVSVAVDTASGSGHPQQATIKVTKSDAPEMFVYECTDSAGTYRWWFEISVWYEKTCVTHMIERLRAPWYLYPLQPLIWAMVSGKRIKYGVANLKYLAERQSEGGRSTALSC